MAKGFGVICKAKRMLKKETLITLYYSFVYPYLQYGIIAWGNTYINVIDPIFNLTCIYLMLDWITKLFWKDLYQQVKQVSLLVC